MRLRQNRLKEIAATSVVTAGLVLGLTQVPPAHPPAPAGAVQDGTTVGDTRSGGAGGGTVVRTAQGRVRGEATAEYTRWLGIPYAAPPVGDLRFGATQPPEAWNGVRDAAEFGGSCVQGTGWDPGYEEPTLTEDCLYLNVYRSAGTGGRDGGRHGTQKADRDRAGRDRDGLPVIVWIHGGGNTGGAGRDTDPAKFVARHDAVYVTVNYRLGALGYLATPALETENGDGSTGNYGILDQQAALRWVQRNIDGFGGDPGNVTIAGQSAGAGNSCVHLSAPGSEGLFDKVIMMSGGCSARGLDEARSTGEEFAAVLGCAAAATQVECLRGKEPAEILAAQQEVRISGAVSGTGMLPQDPLELLEAGELADVPVLLGGTSDERQQAVFSQYDHRGAPLTAGGVDALVEESYPGHADRVREVYPVDDYWSPTVAWGDITSDERACRDQTTRDRMGAGNTTYVYEFAEQDGPPFTSIWRLGVDYPFGATHVNDLGYLWDYLGTALPFSREQVQLGDQMSAYWYAFAATGAPGVAGAPDWPRYEPGGREMQFAAPSGEAVSHAVIDAQHRCGLWDEVSPAE
ncbi:carboxylesterase family protein [Myceligenerans halotolerans]